MKTFFQFIFSKKFLINLGIAVALFFVLGYVVLKLFGVYTSHGEEVTVPDIRNMQVDEANLLLQKDEVAVEINDSIFQLGKKPGIIIEQNPAPESKIKKGRKIYVVINSFTKKKVRFPEIKEYPFRQAQSVLENLGLRVSSIEYVPSEFKNLVLYAKANGNFIDTNTELTVGTSVILVVGKGLSDEKIHLPSFRKMTLDEARKKSFELMVNIGAVRYDVQPANAEDAQRYFVYRQSPIAGTEVQLGKYIDLWLTKDGVQLDAPEEINISNDYDIENFF